MMRFNLLSSLRSNNGYPPPAQTSYPRHHRLKTTSKVVNGRNLTQRLKLFSHNKDSTGCRRFEQSKQKGRKEVGIKTKGFRE